MKKFFSALLCFLACMLIISCAGNMSIFKNWGKITPSTEVRTAFEKYEVNPNYNYYISGSDVYPYAILGLDKQYVLEPDLWKKVVMTQDQLQQLVTDMQSRAVSFNQADFGFAVLDDKGKQIGSWYSLLLASTSIQMKGDNKVMIYTPDVDTYDKYEDDNGRQMGK